MADEDHSLDELLERALKHTDDEEAKYWIRAAMQSWEAKKNSS